MYCYCLFCETGKCDYVARAAMQAFPCRAISPKQIQHTWSKGNMIDREQDLLPGYIFLYTEEPWEEVGTLWRLKGIHRILGEAEWVQVFRQVSQSTQAAGIHSTRFFPSASDGVQRRAPAGQAETQAPQ